MAVNLFSAFLLEQAFAFQLANWQNLIEVRNHTTLDEHEIILCPTNASLRVVWRILLFGRLGVSVAGIPLSDIREDLG